MAIDDVIKLLARFGEFYWSPDGVRDRDEFVELADRDWRDALIYFVREFAYERQGASPDYAVAGARAIRTHAGDTPTDGLADQVWDEALTLLKADADGKGANKKVQPVAPTEGNAIGLIDFVADLDEADYN